ncbi:hypothetical protein BC827DRAFT_940706 [Russula dissimulans]|nr:hypothetical protein BC827DRAFT_940706 [Russula dissimulans]
MSTSHHCAPSSNELYWPCCGFSDHRTTFEPPPEAQITSQPCEGKYPSPFPKVTVMKDLPPSNDTSYLPTSSIPNGGDAPVPLRTASQRRGPNHVPRPLNCFFLFKTDWLAKRKSLLSGIEQDHRQLNRMASSEWRKLPPEAKQRFRDAAYQAKVEHSIKYPGYRFTPKPRGDKRKRKTKRNEPEVLLRNEEAARLVSQGVTGDALRDALAEYDKRFTEEKQHSTVSPSSPPSFPEYLPSIPSSSVSSGSSVILPFPSFDVNQTRSWASQPTSFLDLDTIWDTFVGSSQSVPWAGDVALSQHSSVTDQSQVLPTVPVQDSGLFHVDHLLEDYANFFSPSYSPSTQLFSTDQRLQHPINNWCQQLDPMVGETQGMAAYQAFKPSSGMVQSISNAPEGSDYQNVPLFQANNLFHRSTPMAHFLPF